MLDWGNHSSQDFQIWEMAFVAPQRTLFLVWKLTSVHAVNALNDTRTMPVCKG